MSIAKRLIAISAIITTGALAQECVMRERTTSKEVGQLYETRNITAEVVPWGKGQHKCVVNLEGLTDGKWYPGRGEFIWDGDHSHAKACGAAVELAKKNLLTGLNSSIITSESVVICKEPEEKDRPLLNPKVGTIIDNVNRLRLNTKVPKFYHKGEECRWYLETGWNGRDILQFNGIVCRYGPAKWIIVDKF